MKSDDELNAAIRDVLQRSPDLETAKVIGGVTKILVEIPGWSAHTEPRHQRPTYLTCNRLGQASTSYQRDWLRMLITTAREELAQERCPACGHVLPERSLSDQVAALEKKRRAS